MKAVIIEAFDNYSYPVRLKYVEESMKSHGMEVVVLSSDFDHRNKCEYNVTRKDLELIHVPRYKKNLSLFRMISHSVFAHKVYKILLTLQPEIIYCSAPPNSLVKWASLYKKQHHKVRLITEFGDLWPETLPLHHWKKSIFKPMFALWKRIRDDYLSYSDLLIYECEFFREKLSIVNKECEEKVIYYCKKDELIETKDFIGLLNDGILRMAYIGSINNIIDIDIIVNILIRIGNNRKVIFEIIGDGEKRESLLEACRRYGIKYNYHGIVYEETKKATILCNCHFGLNIMKKSVAVGATMKSMDYLHYGLALVNNIEHDTWNIVNQYNCGFNIDNIENCVDAISNIDDDHIISLRNNARRAYEELFSEKSTIKSFDIIFDSICI